MPAPTCKCSFDSSIRNILIQQIDSFNLCKWLSPNAVTMTSILLLPSFFKYLLNKNIYLVGLLYFIRTIFDVFDGDLARKCNKTSILGSYLDTFNDNMGLSMIITSIILLKYPTYNKYNMLIFFFICLWIISNINTNIETHKAKNPLSKFLLDNYLIGSLLIYIIWVLIISYFK